MGDGYVIRICTTTHTGILSSYTTVYHKDIHKAAYVKHYMTPPIGPDDDYP